MIYSISFIAGLMFGSFANVCIFRLPEEGSLIRPPSHCPACQHRLRVRDNIPVLSYLMLKGRCHFCRAPISSQYPLIELSMGLFFLASAGWFYPDLPRMVLGDLLGFYLLTISIIDYRHKIIPDELSLSLGVLGLLTARWNPYLGQHGLPAWAESLLAAVTGGGFMLVLAWAGEKIFKKEALGGGDVKLMAGFGAVLGWGGLAGPLVLGSFLGALVGGGLLILKRKKTGETIPYGPFLCLGAFISALYPQWWTPFLSP